MSRERAGLAPIALIMMIDYRDDNDDDEGVLSRSSKRRKRW